MEKKMMSAVGLTMRNLLINAGILTAGVCRNHGIVFGSAWAGFKSGSLGRLNGEMAVAVRETRSREDRRDSLQ